MAYLLLKLVPKHGPVVVGVVLVEPRQGLSKSLVQRLGQLFFLDHEVNRDAYQHQQDDGHHDDVLKHIVRTTQQLMKGGLYFVNMIKPVDLILVSNAIARSM